MSVPGSHESTSRSATFLARVDGLLEQAERLAQAAPSGQQFYRDILSELAEILEADGVAVWSVRDGEVSLFFDTAAERTPDWGTRALEAIVRLDPDRTVIVPPGVTGRLPNETEFARCIACQTVAPSLKLAIDVRLPADAQRGENIAEAVTAVAGVVVEFHRGRQLTRLLTLNAERTRVTALCQSLHTSLDKGHIASVLANDGAAVWDVDRVSVLLAQGTGFRLEAATAVHDLNRRANASRALEKLVQTLQAANKPLPWTSAASEHTLSEVTRYLKESGATAVYVEPLGPTRDNWNSACGALVFEMFGSGPPEESWESLADVSRHAALALKNADEWEARSLSGQLQKWRRWTASQKARVLAGTLLSVLALLVLIPADFELEVLGQVQPVLRRQIFAPADGIVTQVAVDNGKSVAEGDVLAVLRNPELDLEEQRIRGDIATASAKLASVRAARLESDRRNLGSASAAQLTADEEELKQQIASLNRQLEIMERRVAELTLKSPLSGKVMRWDLMRTLESRPVQQGQLLLQVADVAGPWQLELRVPDRGVRHVLLAQKQLGKPLPVQFLFRMAPKKSYSAQLDVLDLATELDQEGSFSTLASVRISSSELPDLRPGSSVIAKIHCGHRSLGYVWFRELFDFLQTRVFF